MNWMVLLEQVFELFLIPVLTALGIYLAALIHVKAQEAKQKTKDETTRKYIEMAEKTISECVLATTQTYVEALKKAGKFDSEAQKHALQLTYNSVMKILTEDAKKYITEAVGDFETYLMNKIESQVKLTKSIN